MKKTTLLAMLLVALSSFAGAQTDHHVTQNSTTAQQQQPSLDELPPFDQIALLKSQLQEAQSQIDYLQKHIAATEMQQRAAQEVLGIRRAKEEVAKKDAALPKTSDTKPGTPITSSTSKK